LKSSKTEVNTATLASMLYPEQKYQEKYVYNIQWKCSLAIILLRLTGPREGRTEQKFQNGEMDDNFKHRTNIKFCQQLGYWATENLKILQMVHDEQMTSCSKTYEWQQSFSIVLNYWNSMNIQNEWVFVLRPSSGF
jgi:hypothetical protein